MSVPHIQPLHEALISHPDLLGPAADDSFLGDQDSAFVVVAAGSFRGRWFERGELVVCRAGARSGQAIVLVAHSHGRPRLGLQLGLGFLGDHEEPCSTERWMAAGHIRGVYRRGGEGFVQGQGGPTGWESIDTRLDRPGARVTLMEVGASRRDQRWPTVGGVCGGATAFRPVGGRSSQPEALQLALFAA